MRPDGSRIFYIDKGRVIVGTIFSPIALMVLGFIDERRWAPADLSVGSLALLVVGWLVIGFVTTFAALWYGAWLWRVPDGK